MSSTAALPLRAYESARTDGWVRRAGITLDPRSLQRRKLIRYSRGKMTTLNVRGLEQTACEYYAVGKRIYARFLQDQALRVTIRDALAANLISRRRKTQDRADNH